MTPEANEWRRRIAEQDFRVIVIRTAFVLAQAFGPDGSVQISKGLLAERSGQSVDSVDRSIKALGEAGWLTIEELTDPETGQNMPNLYAYQIPDPTDLTEAEPGPSGEAEQASDASGDVTVDEAPE